MLLEVLAIADEGHVGADRAGVQEYAIVDVTNVRADDLTVARDQRCLAEVGRDVVILGEVVERPAGKDGELDVGIRDESSSRGDRPVATGYKDSLRSVVDRLLEGILDRLRLDCLEIES